MFSELTQTKEIATSFALAFESQYPSHRFAVDLLCVEPSGERVRLNPQAFFFYNLRGRVLYGDVIEGVALFDLMASSTKEEEPVSHFLVSHIRLL